MDKPGANIMTSELIPLEILEKVGVFRHLKLTSYLQNLGLQYVIQPEYGCKDLELLPNRF